MDSIKYVIDELNQQPFNQNLNLITYDNLRDEQRLDLLIQILNIIDPKLNLPFIRVGNIEDIVATILDELRIFKYQPPGSHSNPQEFRKSLIMADKDLLTNIFEWLLRRMVLLKKRAYLARFLVKIELSPDVEGDQDVIILYRQYIQLMEEFKKIHSTYEQQKKAIDSIIELQKDIKTMELEKDQIKNKLDIVKRRVDLDSLESSIQQQMKFESVKQYVLLRHENEKIQRQLKEQQNKIEMMKKQLEQQQQELSEMNMNDWNESIQSPEVLLYRFKDELDIKQKLAKDVLPNELTELRLLVRDLENVEHRSDFDIKEQLSQTVSQLQALTHEINDLMEKKLLDKQNEEDRLSHYRQNAQAVALKKEEVLQKCQELEKTIEKYEEELDELRSKFSIDGESTLRGDSLKLYIENISKRDLEMNEMKEELSRIGSDIDELQSKLRSLKQQEKETMDEISDNEETIGLDGFFQMKESTLTINDNKDAIFDDNGQEQMIDYEQMNVQIETLQDKLEHLKNDTILLTKEVRMLKEEAHETETEFEMKKRMYDSAAAGLEAELSRCESELDRLLTERDRFDVEHFEQKARLLAIRSEQTQLFGPSTSTMVLEQIKLEIENERLMQEKLKQQELEWKEKEDYYRKQMEMWRDLRVIFEVKTKILQQKLEAKTKGESTNIIKDHLVLGD